MSSEGRDRPMRRSRGIRSVVARGYVTLGAAPSGATSPVDDSRSTLNVLIHGIDSRGTDMFDDISSIRQQGTTYRIELVNDAASNRRGLLPYIADSGADPARTQVLRIHDPKDPALKKFIERIAAQPHATVAIDMDLTVTFVPGETQRKKEVASWRDQTDRAAEIALELAQARNKVQPHSQNTLLAHSAGTVALSKVIDSGGGGAFESKIAASPMTWKLSKDVLILQQAGDVHSTETGGIK